MSEKIRFALIGAGWRAMYYVRIAKTLPEYFELCMILCTSEEKAKKLQESLHIPASACEEDLIKAKPDFIVIAAAKNINCALSIRWMEKGYYVLSETPAADDLSALKLLMNSQEAEKQFVTAEQYRLYPLNIAAKKLLDQSLIGNPHYLYLSLAHEYHAASLMRQFLNLDAETGFSVSAEQFSFPSVQTLSRYEEFKDGRISETKRMLAKFVFDQGAVCIYDFDSDQYRSTIRSSHMKLQGVKGEFFDDAIRRIDENGEVHHEKLDIRTRTVRTDSDNPNFREYISTESISFQNEILYEPPFGYPGLSDDEAALAELLRQMDAWVKGNGENPYPLKEALADSYAAILMRKAAESGQMQKSDQMIRLF